MLPPYLVQLVRPTRSPLNAPVQCVEPPRSVPDRAPIAIVVIVLVLAAALIGEGRPVALILQSLAGAGLIGTEVARRIDYTRA